MGERAAPSAYGHAPQAGTMRSAPGSAHPAQRGRDTPSAVFDPTEDDPVEKDHHHNHSGHAQVQVVAPSITVRPEFATIHRSNQPVQPLTCIVVVELQSKRAVGAPIDQEDTYRSIVPASAGMNADEGVYGGYQQVRRPLPPLVQDRI